MNRRRVTRREAEHRALEECLRAIKRRYLGSHYVFELDQRDVKRICGQILIAADVKEFHLSIKDNW